MTHRRGGKRGLCSRSVTTLSPVSPIAGAILSLNITPREKPGSVAGPLGGTAKKFPLFSFGKVLHHEVRSRSRSRT